VIILGGMRLGLFTPTEAAVVAVFYGLFVGMVIHRTIKFRDLFLILREAAELSAVIMMVVALAGIFAWALSTLSIIDPVTNAIINSGLGEYGILALMIVMLIVLGMFLDGISIFLIFVPLFMPIAYNFGWHPVWFGVLLTLNVALGQFTPPVAVNLMVACRIAGVPMESTLRWVGWLLLGMGSTMLLVIAEPEIALWLPRYLGFN
jgi:tripartite ATP-independent transporter DctM subunit